MSFVLTAFTGGVLFASIENTSIGVGIYWLERQLAGDTYEDHDLVFADELGKPIYPSRLTERFDRARKAARIPVGITPCGTQPPR